MISSRIKLVWTKDDAARRKRISCGKCKRVCPMNVDVTDNSNRYFITDTCIGCGNCMTECPVGAVERR